MLRVLLAFAGAFLVSIVNFSARAEVDRVRISRGFSTAYLPLMVMQDRKLLEKHTRAIGLDPITVEWKALDGGNVINDAMLAGTLDIAGTGVPGFITLWSKARNVPSAAVIGISALSGGALWLNTNKPSVKTLEDFGPGDKIALPGIKTSYAAVALQMVAAKEFGVAKATQLDVLTVGLAHPEAFTALTSGKTEITAHFSSPPFSYKEIKFANIHRVLSTRDVLGPLTLLVNFASKRFADANPRLVEAFMAAQSEANALITTDKEEAAAIYLRVSGVKLSHDEIIEILKDPENTFSLNPEGMMAYADFMAQTGMIKTKPKMWQDLFVNKMQEYSRN
ncbi:ABC transporter substrate-binding protein [Methylobacterium aquaticum]|uniref:ABC transporter substrate-binding protein n=1 Tax=Methylobacterium aquaticum TaxID=270351 RepID=UPI003D1639C2